MRILKNYDNGQMSVSVIKTEEQSEEVLECRPMTDADKVKMQNDSFTKTMDDIPINQQPNNINERKRNQPVEKTVSVPGMSFNVSVKRS